ncbi:MAG TPA: mechanosensitive ion channel family protein [Candidatus Acidoferrales bacterium]|nr:mechanosensitive ion channel family protein [Candidatus Acidoferrales bacterium]
MRKTEKGVLGLLLALAIAAGAAALFTHGWANYRDRIRALRAKSRHSAQLVDTQPLELAEQLAPLAVTRTEQNDAQEALRLADHSVDLAFAAVMREAAEHPAPLTPETRALAARIKSAESSVAADQARIADLQKSLAKSRGPAHDAHQERLGILQAQLSLDQDELQDAHDDLIRAGGDKQATIQQLLDQYEASEQHTAAAHPGASAEAASAASVERTTSHSILAEWRAWSSLRSKQAQLVKAQQDALARAEKLSASHDALEQQLNAEKSQYKASRAAPASASAPAGSSIQLLHEMTGEQATLSIFDKRIETEQQLAAAYANWIALVDAREKSFLHGIFIAVLWIALIGLFILLANHWVHRFFARVRLERRELHVARAVILFSLQGAGAVLILLVILGVPANLATVLALCGAGLTLALKDFIIGFIGWFVLMGKHGIHPGDWVEIEGVGGEVLEVGMLHTVLLETGNWNDAGHPTGRKVSFVNSFAIEGHYFNFSTSGQWLWDEIQVQVPENSEPYATAEAIQRIAAQETAANAREAEEEWRRVTPSHVRHSFSAAPSLSVRPSGSGVNILVRYITRASERHQVRAVLYREIVDLLHAPKTPSAGKLASGKLPAATLKSSS